uniref:DUF281 domain-containing protein n=1 Tax=Panagrellus redivivus TaxID=6233 RepID=A0A7E4W4X5_PANRE
MRAGTLCLISVLLIFYESDAASTCYKCISPNLQNYWFTAGFQTQPPPAHDDCDLTTATDAPQGACSSPKCIAYSVYISPTIYGVVRDCAENYNVQNLPDETLVYTAVPNTGYSVAAYTCTTAATAQEPCNEKPSSADIKSLKNKNTTGSLYSGAKTTCESSYIVNRRRQFSSTCVGDVCSLTIGYRQDAEIREEYAVQTCLPFNIFSSKSFQNTYSEPVSYFGYTSNVTVYANTTLCTTEKCNYYNSATRGTAFMAMAIFLITFQFC